jgi:hypothetical protein
MTLRARLQRSPLLGYFALTFAWSWACWALSPAIRPQLPWLATLLMFAGSFGPSLAAMAVVSGYRCCTSPECANAITVHSACCHELRASSASIRA